MRFFLAAVTLCASLMGAQDAQQRLKDASAVLHEVMATPDKGIPVDLIQRASCVVIVPGLKKAALGIGGQYGKGFVTCRKAGRDRVERPGGRTRRGRQLRLPDRRVGNGRGHARDEPGRHE